jgi:hypothetical protein
MVRNAEFEDPDSQRLMRNTIQVLGLMEDTVHVLRKFAQADENLKKNDPATYTQLQKLRKDYLIKKGLT